MGINLASFWEPKYKASPWSYLWTSRRFKKSPQEATGVPGFFRALKLYVKTRMTGENKNTSCGLFL